MATGSSSQGQGGAAAAAGDGATGVATVSELAHKAHARGHDVTKVRAKDAKDNAGHEHDWVEQGRYIPYSDADFDPARQFPEVRRDADGKAEEYDLAAYTTPKPYIYQVCDVPGCGEVQRIEIPEKAYKRILKMLDDGRLLPEHLSQLPLRELVPELADQEARGSGARRVTIDPDEEG